MHSRLNGILEKHTAFGTFSIVNKYKNQSLFTSFFFLKLTVMDAQSVTSLWESLYHDWLMPEDRKINSRSMQQLWKYISREQSKPNTRIKRDRWFQLICFHHFPLIFFRAIINNDYKGFQTLSISPSFTTILI